MQTTKWGPDAWCLFGSIVANYPCNPSESDKRLYQCFFCHLGNILPCIYCRLSYREYIEELPIQDWLSNCKKLRYFLYLFHNKVNGKLRSQGYLKTPNPLFSKIEKEYNKPIVYNNCGWDFLY